MLDRLTQYYLMAQNLAPAFKSIPKPDASQDRVTTIVDEILLLVGILAVLFVIIGGIRYSTSRGDPGQITQAKNTIIYALVGLAITMFAYGIVSFISGELLT